MTVSGHQRIVIFGPCSATNHEMRGLAERGVTDAVLLAFSGSYHCGGIRPGPHNRVHRHRPRLADLHCEDRARHGVGSSALALAALTDAEPDPSWLAPGLWLPRRLS